jgi:hypothetical protein
MNNHRRPAGRRRTGADNEAPSSLVPAKPGSGAGESTRHTAVSKSWLAKRKKREAAFTNGKPKPDNLEGPWDTTETFFETKTTCKLPPHPTGTADNTLTGMLGVQDDRIIDCRNEEGPDGLPFGWKDSRTFRPRTELHPIVSGPPGQGLPMGATASSKASEEPLRRTSGITFDEKTKELFPPQRDIFRMVSHADVLKQDTWEGLPSGAPAETLGGQNPKKTIFGIPIWKR